LAAGLADGFTENAYLSRLQTVPDAVRGHVFGVSATVENLGFGLGMLLSAALLERFPPLPVVAGSHGSAIVLALAFLLAAALRRHTAAARPEPAADAPGGPVGEPAGEPAGAVAGGQA